ncbi:hypothetical protein Fmac_020810 [Flemingia macrophylla]|uniref:Uncharacterized protein n=1 Tax=Flemingia macrophylla TaxID=520843 RepID=A0ABD1LV50_9FABA
MVILKPSPLEFYGAILKSLPHIIPPPLLCFYSDAPTCLPWYMFLFESFFSLIEALFYCFDAQRFQRLRRNRCMWLGLGLGLGIRVKKCLWMIWYIVEWWMGMRLNRRDEGSLSRWRVKGPVLFA